MVYRSTKLIMYKVTSRTTVNNSNLKLFNDEYAISIQRLILEGLAKEMYENDCIAIEQIERNTSDPNNITYTVTGYAITKKPN